MRSVDRMNAWVEGEKKRKLGRILCIFCLIVDRFVFSEILIGYCYGWCIVCRIEWFLMDSRYMPSINDFATNIFIVRTSSSASSSAPSSASSPAPSSTPSSASSPGSSSASSSAHRLHHQHHHEPHQQNDEQLLRKLYCQHHYQLHHQLFISFNIAIIIIIITINVTIHHNHQQCRLRNPSIIWTERASLSMSDMTLLRKYSSAAIRSDRHIQKIKELFVCAMRSAHGVLRRHFSQHCIRKFSFAANGAQRSGSSCYRQSRLCHA